MILPDALDTVDSFFERQLNNPKPSLRSAPELPRRLIQYWDHEPPDQVKRLLGACQHYCNRNKIDYDFYDDVRARALLSEVPRVLAAYDGSGHPAMKSDLFRLYALYKFGGAYLDADMTVRRSFRKVFDAPGTLLLLKWNMAERRNCPNWFFAAKAEHPLLLALTDGVAESINRNQHLTSDELRRRVLTISGPAIFTRFIASWISEEPTTAEESVAMWDADDGYKFVMNGPEFLKEKLAYKSTGKHWAFEEDS